MKLLLYLVSATAAIVLAFQPVRWLIGTWTQPGYQGYPAAVFALVAALGLWSASSPRSAFTNARGRPLAIAILAATLLIRGASQLLAINVVGAFALALDVYALGLLFGLGERQRRISPGWLAMLFLFCLPVEPLFQRSVGFLLQQASASGACQVLGAFFSPLDCTGTRIVVMGREVLVDLPCSGAQLLTTLLMLLTLLGALSRPNPTQALSGTGLALLCAWLANTVRISLLAVGIVFEDLSGVDVMAAPWHEAIGLFCVALGAAPLLYWGWLCAETRETRLAQVLTRRSAEAFRGSTAVPLVFACVALLVALLVVRLTPRPVDVSAPVAAPDSPLRLAAHTASDGALTAQERAYFTRYGGAGSRTFYGPFALLLVRTTSPLRHMHAPDVCLEGGGHDVRYLTARATGVPTAYYASVDPRGRAWRIRVSYVSAGGRVATSVSEVVWHWLRAPGEAWTMVQRIAPASTSDSAFEQFDAAVARAYNLNS